MSLYVLDTNIFIEAHRKTYPIDVATSFWDMIKQLADDGKIISIDKVRDEIEENEDELKRWVQSNLSDEFFRSTDDQAILREFGNLTEWANDMSNHYHRKAIDEFVDFNRADIWLIAYCKTVGSTLVTHEVSNPQQKRKIPIPQPCNHFGVSYCNMIDMFRGLSIRF